MRLGAVQAGALDVYVLDVAHEPAQGLRVEAGRLVVLDAETAWRELCDAANSADADVERGGRQARARRSRRGVRDKVAQ